MSRWMERSQHAAGRLWVVSSVCSSESEAVLNSALQCCSQARRASSNYEVLFVSWQIRNESHMRKNFNTRTHARTHHIITRVKNQVSKKSMLRELYLRPLCQPVHFYRFIPNTHTYKYKHMQCLFIMLFLLHQRIHMNALKTEKSCCYYSTCVLCCIMVYIDTTTVV